jgi:hypothetical protein
MIFSSSISPLRLPRDLEEDEVIYVLLLLKSLREDILTQDV